MSQSDIFHNKTAYVEGDISGSNDSESPKRIH